MKLAVNILTILLVFSAAGSLLFSCKGESRPHHTWEVYKGGPESNNYSSLNQVDKSNVKDLDIAWSFYPDDEPEGFRIWKYECNPIVIDTVMYLVSAWKWLYALNAATGKKIWSFDPLQGARGGGVLRGVTYWKDPDSGQARIFVSARSRLYAVDAGTGEPIISFGEQGSISLDLQGGDTHGSESVRLSTPGIIYQNLIIVGAAVSESPGAPPGPVRAFNVGTGELAWTFHTIPKPGTVGYDTWPEQAYKTSGGANNWAGMSLDQQRGIVFVPTGSPTYDYYAADRIGSNLFGNSLLALNAATGELLWYFQTVHHDIWDYDLPTAPNLITVKKDGRLIDAVAQPTKIGFIYVLERETGEPVFPVEEREVPPSQIPGEQSWPTQPFPLKPQSFSRQVVTEKDIFEFINDTLQDNKHVISDLWFQGLFAPIGFETTILFPGSRGGGEWGGGAYDPETGVLFINSNELPELARMGKVLKSSQTGETLYSAGQSIYLRNCSSCHGNDKQGVESMPSLVDVGERLTATEITDILGRGSSMMPSFAELISESRQEILAYLTETGKDVSIQNVEPRDTSTTYVNVVNKKLLVDTLGKLMIKPPWGTMNAIDMNTGEYRWRIPLGSHPEFQQPGEPPTGMENYGGPVVTGGGLVFIAATLDRMFRAFDKDTGELLWEVELPGNGLANPAVYEVNGKQYISIAVSIGESFNHTKSAMITFALP